MGRVMFAVILNVTLIFSAVSLALPICPSWAAFPGASGKIAFASNRDRKDQIYVMNADGSLQTRITLDKRSEATVDKEGVPIGSDDHPAWSPDGKQIAFDSNRDEDRDIYVMNADGSEVTQLTKDPDPKRPATDSFPAWSPNGKQIAFQSDRECVPRKCLQTEIYVMNADGSQQAHVTMQSPGSGVWDQHPAWSPDGKQIAFDSNRGGGDYDIYVLNVANPMQVKQLTHVNFDDMFPAWSPDGKKIAYQSNQWNTELWVMSADGTDDPGDTVIPRDWGAMVTENAAWSPDSSLIAFDSYRDDPAGKQREIYVTTADGGKPERLTFSSHEDIDPDWHPAVGYPPLTSTVAATLTVTSVVTPTAAVTATVTGVSPTGAAEASSVVTLYLVWVPVVVSVVILIVALAVFRRGLRVLPKETADRGKYASLLAQLDRLRERGEISETLYLRLREEYEKRRS